MGCLGLRSVLSIIRRAVVGACRVSSGARVSPFVDLVLKTFRDHLTHHRCCARRLRCWILVLVQRRFRWLDSSIEAQLVLIIMAKDLVLLRLVNIRPHHLKLSYNLHSLTNVQRQRFEGLINEYFTLLRHLVLSDVIQVGEALMQKCGDILYLLQHLCIIALLNELDQLFEYLLDVSNLFSVGAHNLFLVHEPLFFSFVFPLKLRNDILLLLLDLPLQLRKTILNVVKLELHEPLQLFLDLIKESLIFINQTS